MMSLIKIHMTVTMNDGSVLSSEWDSQPLKNLQIDSRPHATNGANMKDEQGNWIFIPWHNIKYSSYKEEGK
jgi:hypothetical protein